MNIFYLTTSEVKMLTNVGIRSFRAIEILFRNKIYIKLFKTKFNAFTVLLNRISGKKLSTSMRKYNTHFKAENCFTFLEIISQKTAPFKNHESMYFWSE